MQVTYLKGIWGGGGNQLTAQVNTEYVQKFFYQPENIYNVTEHTSLVFPGGLDGKESTWQCRRPGFYPWVGKIPWRREWQPAPVFLPVESHGQIPMDGRLPLMGSQRVRHDWATNSFSFQGTLSNIFRRSINPLYEVKVAVFLDFQRERKYI